MWSFFEHVIQSSVTLLASKSSRRHGGVSADGRMVVIIGFVVLSWIVLGTKRYKVEAGVRQKISTSRLRRPNYW
jgi:hypothetical protein